MRIHRLPTVRPTRLGSTDRDGGQATPLVALVLAAGAGAVVLLALLGGVVSDRAEARTAADAAALAGAAGGEPAARAVAVANHGQLESFEQRDNDVEVTVRVDHARATSRAARRWTADQLAPSR